MKPEEVVPWLDKHLGLADERGYDENRPCLTFTARTSRGLPIRPKVVDQRPNGDKVYMMTVKQARKFRNFAVEVYGDNDGA